MNTVQMNSTNFVIKVVFLNRSIGKVRSITFISQNYSVITQLVKVYSNLPHFYDHSVREI